MMTRGWTLALGVVIASLSVSGAAHAGVGFFIDASTLQFTYTKGAGGPGSFGKIEINDLISSNLVVQHLDLGANGEIGGGDDTLLDLARIGDHTKFSVSFVGDVFKHGSNNYSIVGTVSIGDVNSPPDVIVGNFTSESLAIGGGFFSFGGALGNPSGLLQPANSDAWVFTGLASDTPNIINGQFGGLDGVDGTVRLSSGRGAYRSGSLLDFQFVGHFSTLDAFFNAAQQSSTGADMKITVVPVPGAVVLASLGLAGAWFARRRIV